MRPTPRLAVLLAAAAPLAVIAGSAAPALWTLPFVLTAILLAAFALDAFMTVPARALQVSVTAAPRIFIGETATLTVRIAATPLAGLRYGRRRAIDLIWEAQGPVEPAAPVIAHIAGNAVHSVELTLVPHRRGRVDITCVKLRWRGPFGLNQRILAVKSSVQFEIVPNIRAAQAAALQFNDRDSPFGTKLQRDRGAGTEFDSLRDFTTGMDRGGIDWKHSARHRRLVGKEFRIERNHPIVLAFDTGHLMCEMTDGMPRLDHAIGAGLLLGWTALRGGDLVGLYGFDARVRQWAPPVRGAGSFGRLQMQAATLDYHAEETNFTLALAELTTRLKRRSLVVLFTDFVDTVTAELMVESLQQIGGRHVVIFVSIRDPALQAMVDAKPDHAAALARAVVAQGLLQDRRAVFSRLARLGVHCLDVDRQAVSGGFLNKYTAIKQRGLL